MISNRSMPRCTVIPEIGYPDVIKAARWLCDVFGFTIRLQIARHRVQLNMGECAVVLVEQKGAEQGSSSTMVRVEDVDEHYARAVTHSALIIRSPATYPYGERQYTVEDPAGNQWIFSQSIADVAPESWGGIPGQL